MLAARMRRLRAARVGRTLRLNQTFATRLGWGRHAHRIARTLNSPSANPWSLGFARAVARWQRRSGLRVDGVLSPRAWMQLQPQIGSEPMGTPPPQEPMSPSFDPSGAAPPMPPLADGLDTAAAPPDGGDPGAGMPGGPDGAAPDAPADEPAGEWYPGGGWSRW